MAGDRLKSAVGIIGPKHVFANVRFAPQGSGTYAGAVGATGTVPVLESNGVDNVTRTGTGTYTVTLKELPKDATVIVREIENDTTHFHQSRCESISVASGTISVSHKSCTWATIATGPLPSDVVDSLQVVVLERTNY